MAVFRIEKTRDYTVMSNYHLRNTNLSLKAKGLLSLMLSLPENWDYTTKGLARICRDGVDSIAHILDEDRRRLADEMEQSFYKGKTEEPEPTAVPALDVQAIMSLVNSNPELFKKVLESVQLANNA